jgi:Skp family chaperone for outer membrane proteins
VIRTRMFLLALASFGGMLLLIATSQAQQPGASTPAAQPTQPTSRPTIAVFNMATVMREYGKAKYQVYLLNEERKNLSVDLVDKRGRYVKLTQEIQQSQDPKVKDQLSIQQRDLTRQIEDKDREIQKQLNEKSNVVIATLYDEIKTVVDKTAEMNGYHIVFAYPDASTAEEMKSPYVKELKLKPPAAQPFYVARQVDITGVVIQTLNTWYPAPPVPAQPPVQNPPPAQGTTTGPPPGATPGRQ